MAAMAAMAAEGRSDVGQGLQAKLSQNVAVQTHCLLGAKQELLQMLQSTTSADSADPDGKVLNDRSYIFLFLPSLVVVRVRFLEFGRTKPDEM